MKLASFGDLHGHKFKEFDVKTDLTGSSRLDNIVSTLSYMREYCVTNGIKYVQFTGDLHHIRGRVDTEVQNAIRDEIKKFWEAGIIVIMIAGNHDQYDNSDVPENSLHTYKELPGIHVFDTVGVHRIVECNEVVDIVCAPYSKNAQMIKDFIQGATEQNLSNPILLFHLGISGAFVGSGNYPMADAFSVDDLHPEYFKYIIGGHFHKAQFLTDSDGNKLPHAFYCGAPIQHSFGDEGEDKGFFVVDTAKRWDVQFVPIPNPKFVTMVSPITAVWEEVLQDFANNGDYVRVQLKESELDGFKSIAPSNLHYKVELQREFQEQSRSNVKMGMSFEEIVSNYAEEHFPEAKEIGLKILEEVLNNGGA